MNRLREMWGFNIQPENYPIAGEMLSDAVFFSDFYGFALPAFRVQQFQGRPLTYEYLHVFVPHDARRMRHDLWRVTWQHETNLRLEYQVSYITRMNRTRVMATWDLALAFTMRGMRYLVWLWWRVLSVSLGLLRRLLP